MSEYLWVEKYRPKKIQDCILSQDIKETFSQFLKQEEIPNLLLLVRLQVKLPLLVPYVKN